MKKSLLKSALTALFCIVSLTAMAEAGKKYQVVYYQNYEDSTTIDLGWNQGVSSFFEAKKVGDNTFLGTKASSNINELHFSIDTLEIAELAGIKDYQLSYVYGLCPSGASQGSEKNVFYYRINTEEGIDTLFSIYSYRCSSASATAKAEIRLKSGDKIAEINIGRRYLDFPDYIYRFEINSDTEVGTLLSIYNITNDADIKFTDGSTAYLLDEKATSFSGFGLCQSASASNYTSLQVFDDLTIALPTDEFVAEAPTISISKVTGDTRWYSLAANAHEAIHFAISATEEVPTDGWDEVEGEPLYEDIDEIKENSYIWAYTTYENAVSDTVCLYVETGAVVLAPVTFKRESEKSNKITLTASQTDVLLSPVPVIHFTINDGDEQIAEAKTSTSVTIEENTVIKAWATAEGYTQSEVTEASFELYVAQEYVPSEYVVYHWESDNGNVTEYGGTISYENGDGSNRLNTSVGGYYCITLNGKKANIDDETASANAGHMDIVLNEGHVINSGDIITVTAFKNNGDASKLANPYFRFMPSGVALYDDSVNFGDVKIEGETPTTHVYTVPEGVEGDTKVQMTRNKSNTNCFIAVLDIQHPDPNGIQNVNADAAGTNVIYDLLGRRIQYPAAGQMFIINGKKYLMK